MLNCYLVVADGRGSGEQLDQLLDVLSPEWLSNVPFVPHRVTIHRHRDWPVLLFAAELEVAGLGGGRTQVDGDILVADGIPLVDELLPAPSNVAERFHALLGRRPLSSLPGSVAGGWSIVSCSRDGIQATADAMDSAPVYWGSSPELVVISNRASLAALALSRGHGLPVDLVHVAEQVSFRSSLDSQTRFEGVRMLEPGRVLRVPWGQGPVVTDGDWVPGAPDPGLAELPERDRYDLAFSALRAQWEALDRLGLAVIPCGLTGGLDSRATLAGALGAGVAARVGAFTWGTPDSPEVEVAEIVRRRLGVARHEVLDRSMVEADPDRLWEMVQIHAWLYEGMISAWDGLIEPLADDGDVALMVTGFGGELHRRHVRQRPDAGPPDAMREFVLDLRAPIDRFGLLRPEPRAAMVDRLDERIARYEALPLARGGFGSLAYLESRLAHWARRIGAARIEQQRCSPLAHPVIFDVNLHQSDRDRLDSRLHFELLHRAGRDLVETPFLKFEWSERIRSLHPELELPGPARTSARPSTRAIMGQKFRLYDEDHDRVTAFLLDDPESVLFDVVARERLEDGLAANPPGTSPSWVRTCYTLISLKMALESGGREQRHVLDSRPTELVTNIPGLGLDSDRHPSAVVVGAGSSGVENG